MAEAGEWWANVEDCTDHPSLKRWKDLIRWNRSQPEFGDFAYLRIGDNLEDFGIPATGLLADVEAVGVVMPRLIVDMTRKGSLTGLSGCVVLT